MDSFSKAKNLVLKKKKKKPPRICTFNEFHILISLLTLLQKGNLENSYFNNLVEI